MCVSPYIYDTSSLFSSVEGLETHVCKMEWSLLVNCSKYSGGKRKKKIQDKYQNREVKREKGTFLIKVDRRPDLKS